MSHGLMRGTPRETPPAKSPGPRLPGGLLFGGAMWTPDGGAAWDVLLMVLALAAVLVLAYFVSKALSKRMLTLNKTPHMRVLDRLVIGRDRYVLILQIGERILCVGVAQNHISLLTEMEPQEFYVADRQQAFGQTGWDGADGKSAAGRPSAFSGFMARFWSYFVSYFTGRPPRIPGGEEPVRAGGRRPGADPEAPSVRPERERDHIVSTEPVSEPEPELEPVNAPPPAPFPQPEPAPVPAFDEPPPPPAADPEPAAAQEEPAPSPGRASSPEPEPAPASPPEPQADPGPVPQTESEPPLSSLYVSMPPPPDTAAARALLSRYQKPVPPPPAPVPPPLKPEQKREPLRKPPSRLGQLREELMLGEEPGGKDFGELLRRELDRGEPPSEPGTAEGEDAAVDNVLSRIRDLQKRYEKKLESER